MFDEINTLRKKFKFIFIIAYSIIIFFLLLSYFVSSGLSLGDFSLLFVIIMPRFISNIIEINSKTRMYTKETKIKILDLVERDNGISKRFKQNINASYKKMLYLYFIIYIVYIIIFVLMFNVGYINKIQELLFFLGIGETCFGALFAYKFKKLFAHGL